MLWITWSEIQFSFANVCSSFQGDSSSSFKGKLFHPQLCSAGTSTFAICYHLMCGGWKQRKYLEMAKIYIESRQKYTFLLCQWMSQWVLPCLMFPGVIHPSPLAVPTAQARLGLHAAIAGGIHSGAGDPDKLPCLRNYLQTLSVPKCPM